MRAATYARFSTDMQSETSIADQERICGEYAARHGWHVIERYQDQGISGTALGNRPGVLRLRDAAFARRFDVILVTDLNRLARSEDLPPLIQRLRFNGIRVIGVQDGFDSDARTARMQAGMSAIMGAEFIEMVRARTYSALEIRAKLGKPTGGKAYEDPEIVREIFTRFADGESMKAIASDLNRRDVPSPGANWKARARPRGRWQVSTLHALLHNERYVGRMVWNRSQWVKDPDSGKRIRRERPESEWIVQQVEPMIDEATWRRAQARFAVRPGRGGGPRYLLSGILECAVCGGKMTIYGGDQHRYVCGTYHVSGAHACSNRSSFPRQTAERLILEPVIRDLLSPEAIAEGIRLMRAERIAPPKPEPQDRELVELQRLVRDGILSADTAAPAIAEARRKAEARRAAAPAGEMPWPTEKAWRDAVSGMREILTGKDIAAAREILRELIGPAICHPAQDGNVIVSLTTRNVLLTTTTLARTGTGSSIQFQSGPPLPTQLLISIPVSTRKRGSS